MKCLFQFERGTTRRLCRKFQARNAHIERRIIVAV
ncbi:Uncharacterised protein [Shigella sonnei]|nr:Uncharacterised protein [Shigella sonnei]SRN31894.1 Uncharacterised protein [Shigella flexneri]